MQRRNSLEIIRNKIIDTNKLEPLLYKWRLLSQKIVFTNGCFDLIHLGHIEYLSKASDEGDVLIIGLNSDASASQLKGPSRPINSQEQRAMVLASLLCVNAVVIFHEPTPYQLICTIQPDILIKGGDYKPEDIVGYDVVKAKNGIVKTIEFLSGYSTTIIEDKIRSFK